MTYERTVVLLFFTTCVLTIKSIYINPLFILHPLTYVCIFIFIFLAKKNVEFKNLPTILKKVIIIYWVYSCFITGVGLVLSETYWDYKNVLFVYIPSAFISFSIFLGLEFEKNLVLLKFLMNKIFPLFAIIGIILYSLSNSTLIKYNHDLGILLSPIFFFILAIPFVTRKNKVLIIFFSICCILIDPSWRANIMRISACSGFVFVYLILGLHKKLLNMIGILTFIIPLIFLYTGYTGKLDIFEYSQGDTSELTAEQKLQAANTRSFLYMEIINSMKKKDTNFLIGGGASNGYLTIFFHDDNVSMSSKRERYGTEVAFLNTLNRSGLIGVLLEMLLIFIAAYYAINRSNNNFSKLIGLYLYFSYILYFLEVPQTFNSISFIQYFIIGICMNNSFRQSSNEEVKFFFKSL